MEPNRKEDEEFEKTINDYLDAAIELESSSYGQAEPFEQYAAKLRAKLADEFRKFRKSYAHGYTVIMNEIHLLHPDKDLSSFHLLGDEGQTLSDEMTTYFYEAGNHLLETKRYQDALDAFYFLVSFAPEVAEFWLDLGFCYAQFENYQQAIDSYARAIELKPQAADGYLAIASTYVRMQDYEQAQKTCDFGLQHAKAHSGQGWAEELKSLLEEGKLQIETLYNESKYGTFSS